MSNWQVTATTIYCDAVDDDVTIMVYKDWTARCTGYKKYSANPDTKMADTLKKRGGQLGRNLKCEGPLDHRVTDYIEKLVEEDNGISLTANK